MNYADKVRIKHPLEPYLAFIEGMPFRLRKRCGDNVPIGAVEQECEDLITSLRSEMTLDHSRAGKLV